MPWSELNWQASFRGVPFRLDDSETDAGRRYAEHRAPQRIFPVMEDLGRAERRYVVQAYVHGDDSIEQRDRLLEACEQRGAPGDLVHPLYGVVLCWCESVRVRESQDRLRVVRLTLTFREASEQRLVLRRKPGVSTTDAAAAEMRTAAEAATAADLQVAGQPQGVIEQAAEVMRRAGQALLALDVLSGPSLEVAALATAARRLILQASDLATSPVDFARELADAVEGVLVAAGDAPKAVLEAYRALTGLEAPPPPGGPGPAAQAAAGNAELALGLVHSMAIAGMVRAAARVQWAYFEQALEARAELEVLLDELADSGLGGDATYQAAAGLRRALYATVPPPDQSLPRIDTVELAAATPAVVLAYRLYDDAARGDEIALRNRLRFPGFLPSGVPLEVLTDA